MKFSSPRIFAVIILLWFAGLGAAAQFAKIAVPLSLFQAHYPEAGTQIGWLLSIVSVVGMLFGMAGGMFISRMGFARPLMGALLLGAAISWRQASLPSMPEMFVLRLVEGVSHLTIVIAAPTLIGIIAPLRYRGLAMALWSCFFGVSFALMAVIGLPLTMQNGLGWMLQMHAVWLVATAILLMPLLRGFTLPHFDESLGKRSFIAEHLAAYRSALIAAPAWGWLFYTNTYVAGLAILPILMKADIRLEVATVMPLLGIAVSLLVVPLLLRFMRATWIVTIGFVMAFGLCLIGLLGWRIESFSLVLFATLGLIQGGSFAAVPQLNPSAQDQALANGVMAQAGNLGNMLGIPALLAVQVHGGERGLMAAFAALYLAGALAHVVMARMRERIAP